MDIVSYILIILGGALLAASIYRLGFLAGYETARRYISGK